MATSERRQRSYDHRLRNLVRQSGDPRIATDLGVPRSTVKGWLRETPRQVVTLDVLDMREPELQLELLRLRLQIQKLRALLRLLAVLLRISGFSLANQRLPEEQREKLRRSCRTIDRARKVILAPSPTPHSWPVTQHVTMPGVASRKGAPSTTCRPVPDPRPNSSPLPEIQNHQGNGDVPGVSPRPDRNARCPRPTTRKGLRFTIDMVSARSRVRLATASTPTTPGEAQGWSASNATGRNLAHRHDGHPTSRRNQSLLARGDRQFFPTDPRLAVGGHIRPRKLGCHPLGSESGSAQ